jgi:cholesterol oxidase
MPDSGRKFDYDWVVIGSGFGGSVAALRLVEKGYRVLVLERGRRFADDELPASTSQSSRYLWMPRVGLRGIFRIMPLRHVLVGAGCGVGGGSLGYGAALYRADPDCFREPQWAELADWHQELDAHYAAAERMLGVDSSAEPSTSASLLEQYAAERGFSDTCHAPPLGIFLGSPGVTVPDPYFGGAGPDRTGCVRCGSCMTGCRVGAKNTLTKNYLWFAEKAGVRVLAEREAVDIRPRGADDGSDGYVVEYRGPGGRGSKGSEAVTCGAVVFAAGSLGTVELLHRCRAAGSLPRLSDRVGHGVRTNGESVVAVTGPRGSDFTESTGITRAARPDPRTLIEASTYGPGADSQSPLFWPMTDVADQRGVPRRLASAVLRNPRRTLRTLRIRGWSRRTLIVLVMSRTDGTIQLRPKGTRRDGSIRLATEVGTVAPAVRLPAAYEFAEWLAERIGGSAQATISESTRNIPTTVHLLGGASIAAGPDTGVVDRDHHVFGYRNLIVCDGSVLPVDLGVNPSLTITALAERAMAKIPNRDPAHDSAG